MVARRGPGVARRSRGAWVGGALMVAACSGKPRPEDAARAVVARDATSGPVTSADPAPSTGGGAGGSSGAAPGAGTARGGTGDLQLRVDWPDVPAAARRAPGRTPCNTPRAPSVAPTTTWGIPDALVVVDGAAPPDTVARVTLGDCTLTPRIAVGSSLAITSAVDRPAKLVLRKRGTLDHLVAGDPIAVMLPIAGHTVTAALEPGAIYSLETDAADPEVAFIAALPNGYVTEANGQILVADLAAGPHGVTAWLPPRAGQPARTARGTATVAGGELTPLTITLAP